MNYRIKWDGIYSTIERDVNGEFDTWAQAKAALVRNHAQRVDDWRDALKRARSMKKSEWLIEQQLSDAVKSKQERG